MAASRAPERCSVAVMPPCPVTSPSKPLQCPVRAATVPASRRPRPQVRRRHRRGLPFLQADHQSDLAARAIARAGGDRVPQRHRVDHHVDPDSGRSRPISAGTSRISVRRHWVDTSVSQRLPRGRSCSLPRRHTRRRRAVQLLPASALIELTAQQHRHHLAARNIGFDPHHAQRVDQFNDIKEPEYLVVKRPIRAHVVQHQPEVPSSAPGPLRPAG